MVHEMRRRGNYYMYRWMEDGSPPTYDFSRAIAELPADIEFVDWLLAQPIDGDAFERGMAVDQMVPSNF